MVNDTWEIFSDLLCSASISILFGVMVSIPKHPLFLHLGTGNGLTRCIQELSQGPATQNSPEFWKVPLLQLC